MNNKALIVISLICVICLAETNFSFGQKRFNENNGYDSLVKQAELFSETKPKASLDLSILAYQEAVKNNNSKQELEALKLIAKAHYKHGNNQYALKHYNLALSLAIKENDKISEIEILNNIGVLYRLMGSFHQSFEKHSKALELCNQFPETDLIKAQVLNELGVLYRNLNENDKAIENYKKALELSSKINYSEGEGLSYQNIGNILYYKKEFDSALIYYNKALQAFSEKNISPNVKSGILNNIGNVYRMKKDYNNAFKYYNNAFKIINEIEDRNLEATLYKNIAKTYKDKGEQDSAEKNFLKSSLIANNIELKRVLIEDFKELADLYEKKLDFKKALEYYKLFSLLNDSVYKNERRIHISELEMRYNAKKQEEDINQFKLKRQRSNIIFLSVTVLFLIIITFINHKNLRIKKRVNKLILEQKTKLESLYSELKDKNIELEKHRYQLIESEQLYRMIFENSPLGNALFDSHGNFLKVNKSMIKILGLVSEKEIAFKSIFDFPILKRTNILLDFKNVILKNKFLSGEIQIRSADGNKLVIFYHLYPIVDSNDKVTKVQAIAVDITNKYLQDKAISVKNEELQKMNATKDRFFSIIAHDLKNPFNAVMGFANLLKDDYDGFSDEERKQFIESIALASEEINNLLENLLKWAWSQSGKIDFNPEKINAISIINECIDLVKVQAEKKQIKLERVDSEPIYIYVDTNMIRTVIRNLLTNSLKYTPSGGEVKVNFMTKKLSSENGYSELMEIAVSDNGIGISEDDLKKLFKIGSGFKNLGTDGETGTGLGLILCKEFVQKNGGTLHAESTLGKGSTFIFTVPLFTKKVDFEKKIQSIKIRTNQ